MDTRRAIGIKLPQILIDAKPLEVISTKKGLAVVCKEGNKIGLINLAERSIKLVTTLEKKEDSPHKELFFFLSHPKVIEIWDAEGENMLANSHLKIPATDILVLPEGDLVTYNKKHLDEIILFPQDLFLKSSRYTENEFLTPKLKQDIDMMDFDLSSEVLYSEFKVLKDAPASSVSSSLFKDPYKLIPAGLVALGISFLVVGVTNRFRS